MENIDGKTTHAYITWQERIFKEFNGKELTELHTKGQEIYRKLPSYRDIVQTQEYNRKMQEKHDYVYNKITRRSIGEKIVGLMEDLSKI